MSQFGLPVEQLAPKLSLPVVTCAELEVPFQVAFPCSVSSSRASTSCGCRVVALACGLEVTGNLNSTWFLKVRRFIFRGWSPGRARSGGAHEVTRAPGAPWLSALLPAASPPPASPQIWLLLKLSDRWLVAFWSSS